MTPPPVDTMNEVDSPDSTVEVVSGGIGAPPVSLKK